MRRIQKFGGLFLLGCGFLLTSCGGGSSRVLESISISPNPAVAKNGTAQLVATVTPLAVDWSQNPCDNVCDTATPAVIGPISVDASGVATCAKGWTGTAPVQATAPKDPSLAPDTQNVPIVRGTANLTCE